MTGKGYEQLTIDTEFKNLIRPLNREEYAQLEANLVVDGCREPIATWNGVIVDGHNRYEVCNRLHIPYMIQEMAFDGRSEAIAWICGNQLGRRNITEETRKYLIGRQYEAEKDISFRRNANGHNQYTSSYKDIFPTRMPGEIRKESSRRTAIRLGDQHHISSGAVQKYAKYSKALDTLGEKMPELVPKILSGSYKISHANIVALSEMDAEEVKELSTQKGLGTVPFIRYSESRRDFSNEPIKKPGPKPTSIPAIKIMPEYDPDALAKGLIFTIPSWAGSIDRIRTNGDMSMVSCETKERLYGALELLQSRIQLLFDAIKEES